jgi:hypothetical protein
VISVAPNSLQIYARCTKRRLFIDLMRVCFGSDCSEGLLHQAVRNSIVLCQRSSFSAHQGQVHLARSSLNGAKLPYSKSSNWLLWTLANGLRGISPCGLSQGALLCLWQLCLIFQVYIKAVSAHCFGLLICRGLEESRCSPRCRPRSFLWKRIERELGAEPSSPSRSWSRPPKQHSVHHRQQGRPMQQSWGRSQITLRLFMGPCAVSKAGL